MSKYAKLITATSTKETEPSSNGTQRLNTAKKPRKYASYITGPIPSSWVCDACKMGGKEARFAWVCWFLYGVNNRQSFSLSNIYASRFGLSRDMKREAIKSLEKAGMIEVERPPSKSPVITITVRDLDFSKTLKEA